MLVKQPCYIQTKCIDYIEKWPFTVIFQYNLYIFGIHFLTVFYPKPCYNEPCYKEIVVYLSYIYLDNLPFLSFTFEYVHFTVYWCIITKTRLFKYIETFTSKNWKIPGTKTLIFFIFLLQHVEAVLTSSHNLCFWAKIRKNNIYPCKPQFYYIKVGFKAFKII